MIDSHSSEEEEPVINENMNRTSTSTWPRFLVISSIDDQPLRLNPFATAKTIQGLAGDVKDVKKIRKGFLLVEVKTEKQSKSLQTLTQIVEKPVKVSPHTSINSSKAIIRDKDRCLDDASEEELLENLKSQAVTAVKRFTS